MRSLRRLYLRIRTRYRSARTIYFATRTMNNGPLVSSLFFLTQLVANWPLRVQIIFKDPT